jgi:mannose-6-phosphate isomerase-like protein (cupin superfamily)
VKNIKTVNVERAAIFQEVNKYLEKSGFKVVAEDQTRPWGGFFVIDENQAESFRQMFFPEVSLEELIISGKLSPKILLVEPRKRLSWQYHFRRAEIWSVVAGTVGVVTSETDVEKDNVSLPSGSTIRLKQGQRHRLIGLDGWGIIAEIWQHTDAANPSDEQDIVRLQDDFGR